MQQLGAVDGDIHNFLLLRNKAEEGHLIFYLCPFLRFTGISEGFQQNPSQELIIDETFSFFEASAESETNVDTNEQIDLEEQDPEYVYRFVKETVQSYYTSENYYRRNQENLYFSPKAGSNREYALIIEKTMSKAYFDSQLVELIYEQVKNNAWKYGYEIS